VSLGTLALCSYLAVFNIFFGELETWFRVSGVILPREGQL